MLQAPVTSVFLPLWTVCSQTVSQSKPHSPLTFCLGEFIPARGKETEAPFVLRGLRIQTPLQKTGEGSTPDAVHCTCGDFGVLATKYV